MQSKDELKGKGKQVEGAVKENLGRIVGNPELEDKGSAERAEGKVQDKFGKVKRKVGEAIEDLGDKIAG